MKVVCAQTDLSAKLSLLSRVVPTNPTHPILANVLLTAKPDSLGLSVFDLSLGIQVWIPATGIEPGSITLPARFFSDIVSRLPNTEVTIGVEELTATLECGTGHYQMQGIEADEFPALPELDTEEPLKLPSAILLEGLQGALFAASSDESKQILTGLHLGGHSDALEFAATDGHRLAVANAAAEAADLNVTVPARALRDLERMLGRQETEVMLRFDQSQVIFEFATEQGLSRLTSRLLEGQFPAYNQLIPRQFQQQITVERQLLISGLERVAVLAAQKNNVVTFKLDTAKQQLGISAEAPQFGSGQEAVPAQISGDDLEIAFNVKYLIEGLKAMAGTEIQIQLNSATAPAIIRPLTGHKMTYLIMPIQIRN